MFSYSPTSGTRFRVAVTGSEGFVGRHLLHELLNRKCEVVRIDRPNTGAHIGVDLGGPDVNVPELAGRLGAVDVVIYMAATITRGSSVDAAARRNLRCIAETPVRLIEALSTQQRSPPHLVYCSTYKMYGRPILCGGGVIDPDDPPQQPDPHSYGSAKFFAERLLAIACERSQFRYAVVRPTCIYGPGQHLANAIPRFLSAALAGTPPVVYGDGMNLRDDVYAPDLAAALAEAAIRRASGAFHAGGGTSRTVLDVAQHCVDAVARLTGSRPPPPQCDPSKPPKWWLDQRFDLSATIQRLGYRPTPFSEGLLAEAAWLQDGAAIDKAAMFAKRETP